MTKELVISANRHETKVAILEDDVAVELYFQRANEYSLAGSIHKGRVTRVLPGMQSAFVDLGLERDTFLYVSDFFEEHEDFDRIPNPPPPAQAPAQPIAPPASGTRSAEAPVAAAAPAAPLAPPVAAEKVQFAPGEGGREGRGDRRRGRRRRGRGRGLPESKYASEPRAETEREAAVAQEPPALSEAPEAEEFPVLPGESLAKYSRGGAAPALEDTEAGDEEHDTEPDEADPGAGLSEPHDTAPVSEEPLPTPLSSPIEIAEAGEYPPDNAEPDAPEHSFEAEPEPEAAAIAEIREEETLSVDVVSATVEEMEEPRILPLDEDEDREIQSFIFGEERDADEEGAIPEERLSEPDELSAPEGAGAAESGPQPLRADVRDQGGRYLHRVSRRMRRRNRGGEGRESREARPSEVAPPRPEAARQDQRSVARPDRPAQQPSITDLLKEGQEIIVQIAKEPLGQKGARITSHIALPGRYVVYMPTLEHMGVSRRIPSDEERHRLKRILQAHREEIAGGCIVRTAGEGHTEEEIVADMKFLFNLWQEMKQKAEKRRAPALLHHDLDIVERVLRDQVTEGFKAIWVDNEEVYERVLGFVQQFQPALMKCVKMYTRPEPIFDAFNITAEIEKALRPKVWLKSGGYIVINQTEALVAIDVNTGKYVGKSNRLEDTIVKTNTEAVKEIVRQIRLRDLGGIIVVDFIDMDERKNRQKVMQVLEETMRTDRAPYKILQFNDFGLVAITRKRVKQSLERTLCAPCPYCEAAGYVKSVPTVISEMLQEALKIASAIEGKDVVLRCHPEVAKTLKSNQNSYLEELEEILKRPVLVKGDPALHHEKFDLA